MPPVEDREGILVTLRGTPQEHVVPGFFWNAYLPRHDALCGPRTQPAFSFISLGHSKKFPTVQISGLAPATEAYAIYQDLQRLSWTLGTRSRSTRNWYLTARNHKTILL